MHETELKLKLADPDAVRARLRELGARLDRRVEGETDMLFRSATDAAALEGQVLRLRVSPQGGLLTWKGPARYERSVKSREERQTPVDDPEAMRAILERIGFRVALEYAKTREYWELGGLAVSVDVLPFGTYMEIEGDEAAIDGVVLALGLGDAECVEEGYPTLAARWRDAAAP